MENEVNRSSMLYWWPRVENIDGIRKPKTILVPTDTLKCLEFLDGKGWPLDVDDLKSACERIGYPVFMRTDHYSGKHSWNKTCFVEGPENLLPNFARLIDKVCMVELPIDAIAIREYIPMATLFYAFHGKMPINPEIRFFVRDGRVECWHWYWIPEAIKKSGAPVLDKMANEIYESEWRSILINAQQSPGIGPNHVCKIWEVAPLFQGYWSIDFCLSVSGEWVLIDMAEGEKSWHPECEFKP
ncbi:MAG TPA: hypothetical protein PK395_18770 [bacterium]|nr:hypothetical protein [bacterium]